MGKSAGAEIAFQQLVSKWVNFTLNGQPKITDYEIHKLNITRDSYRKGGSVLSR